MKGKNLSRNNKWGKAEKSNLHYKLYKSGKQWVTASLFMLSLGTVLITAPNRVWADTVNAATAETTESTAKTASSGTATSIASSSSDTNKKLSKIS